MLVTTMVVRLSFVWHVWGGRSGDGPVGAVRCRAVALARGISRDVAERACCAVDPYN